MVESRELTPYFRRLSGALSCPKSCRTVFLSEAQRMAGDFVQGKPDATSQDVETFLGEPEELARSFLDSLEPEVMDRYHARRKWTRRAAAALTAVVILLLAAWVVHLWNRPIRAEVIDTIIIYEET